MCQSGSAVVKVPTSPASPPFSSRSANRTSRVACGNALADAVALLSEARRRTVFRLHPPALARPVSVPTTLCDDALEPPVTYGAVERVAVLERRHQPHPRPLD